MRFSRLDRARSRGDVCGVSSPSAGIACPAAELRLPPPARELHVAHHPSFIHHHSGGVHHAARVGIDHRSVEGISGAVADRLGVSMGMLLGASKVDAERRPSRSDGRIRTAIARVAVLRTEVARPNATLLLVELVLPDRHREFTAKWADLEMLLFTGGRELLRRSDFRLKRLSRPLRHSASSKPRQVYVHE